MSITKHYVTFLSPGTFLHEESTKEIPEWNVEAATTMAREITARYNATPFAFQFSTRERGDGDFDSKQTKKSGRYFLGGKIETVADVEARNDPDERILLSNMKRNGWDRIVVNTNSFMITQPLNADDTVLEYAV